MNTPQCNVYKKCSGCQLLNMTYSQQLKWKQIKAERLMGTFGKVNKIIGMDNPYHYRNKVQTLFRPAKSGKIITGVYQSSTNGIVAVESCLLNNKRADRIAIAVKTVAKRLGISIYSPKTRDGFLKYTLVRTAFNTGENMLVLVTSDNKFPKKDKFIAELLSLYPKCTTIVQNISNSDKLMLGNKEHILYGSGKIQDVLCGCKFIISPKSFYQVNPQQTEVLYKKAIEIAQLTGDEIVIDAYCGTGTIGILASKYAKRVVGVELNPDAIKDAKENAQLNNRTNISFFNKDAGNFLEEISEDEVNSPEVLFVDPPRAGCNRTFLNSAAKIKPERIVYISCNPTTQQRDVKFLIEHGYNIEEIQPIDMFPHTNHVETVVLLSHKKPDGHINVKVEFGEGEGKVPLENIAKRAESYKPKERVTYKMIKEYIEAKYGFKVHTAYIAEVKRDLGLPMYDAPNAVEELKQPRKHPTAEKVEAIKDALKHFEVI